MTARITLLTIFLAFNISNMPRLIADTGKALYEESCTGCHDTSIFTRTDRQVSELKKLRNRVRQCNYAIESNWFDEDIDAVTEYLNKHFYKL